MRKSIKSNKLKYINAPDVKAKVGRLIIKCGLLNFDVNSIHCLRSSGAKTRAIARIWGLSRVWQDTLQVGPAYIIEVISEKYDNLPDRHKDEVIIHELMHIPKNFSGALVPHFRKGKRNFFKKVNNMIKKIK